MGLVACVVELGPLAVSRDRRWLKRDHQGAEDDNHNPAQDDHERGAVEARDGPRPGPQRDRLRGVRVCGLARHRL